MTAVPLLRIGFIGSGFIAKFHLKSFESVRHAQISGVYSPTPAKRAAFAEAANDAQLGPCRTVDLDDVDLDHYVPVTGRVVEVAV